VKQKQFRQEISETRQNHKNVQNISANQTHRETALFSNWTVWLAEDRQQTQHMLKHNTATTNTRRCHSLQATSQVSRIIWRAFSNSFCFCSCEGFIHQTCIERQVIIVMRWPSLSLPFSLVFGIFHSCDLIQDDNKDQKSVSPKKGSPLLVKRQVVVEREQHSATTKETHNHHCLVKHFLLRVPVRLVFFSFGFWLFLVWVRYTQCFGAGLFGVVSSVQTQTPNHAQIIKCATSTQKKTNSRQPSRTHTRPQERKQIICSPAEKTPRTNKNSQTRKMLGFCCCYWAITLVFFLLGLLRFWYLRVDSARIECKDVHT